MKVRLSALLLGFAVAAVAGEPVCRTPLGAPCFTIETKRTQTILFRDGWWDVGAYTTVEKRAQGSDGSFAVITEYSSTTLQGRYQRQERMFFDASARTRYWLAPVKKSFTTDAPHIPPRPLRPLRRDGLECEPVPMTRQEHYVRTGSEKILGFDTVHWHSDLPRGGTVDLWTAPALDCTALRAKRVEKGSLRTTVSTDITETLRVEAGEPHRSFFSVPAGYHPDDDPRHFRYGTRR